MQPVLNIEDVKCVEVALTREGVSVSELMHRAGCAAAEEVLDTRPTRKSTPTTAGSPPSAATSGKTWSLFSGSVSPAWST